MQEFAFVVLIALDGLIGTGVPETIERFGGETASIQAVFVKSTGDEPIIEASLFIGAEELLAPHSQPTAFVASSNDDPRLVSGTFSIPLPEVKKPTGFHVVISAKSGDAQFTPCANFGITVFPRDFFAKSLPMDDKRLEVGIAGAFPGLRELLRENSISYFDFSIKNPPILREGAVLVIEIPPGIGKMPLFKEPRQIVFSGGTRVPNVLKATGKSIFTGTPAPEDFRDSPFAQRLLLEMLE